MSIHTKFGYQFLGKPPESYRAKCGGSKGIKIVGNEADLTQLRDWNVEIKQARLITAEKKVEAARDRNNLAEIPALAAELAEEFAGVDARLGVAGVWYEIPPIMPAVTPWTARWYAAAATAFRRKGLRSVVFGFATGTPQVAPWAGQGDHGPDEWPQMYDCLAVLHSLGTDWVRIGVEEYIAGGKLHPADFSNVGRIKEVYERHLRPHGWNIVFRGIEAGYDNPGMKDAGIIPQNLINGNAPADAIEGGLAMADARYAALPYVDCMFLYQVSDPVVYTNEAKFAFTPGDRHAPVGYLETMQAYFAANPPVPFVAPKPGTTTPPPDPEPEEPAPQPAPVELIVNGDFTGGTYSVPGSPDQRIVPNGWRARDPRDRTEIELDPRFRPPSARIIEAYEKREIAYDQDVAVEAGATYRITMPSAPWCTTNPSSPFSAGDSSAEIRLRVNGTLVGSLSVLPGAMPDQFVTIIADVKATVDRWTVGCGIKPQYPVARTDLRLKGVSMIKIKDAVPTTPPPPAPEFPAWYVVKTGGTDRLRKRLSPVDGEIVELQVNGSELLIESITDGWAKEKGAGLYASAAYLVRK